MQSDSVRPVSTHSLHACARYTTHLNTHACAPALSHTLRPGAWLESEDWRSEQERAGAAPRRWVGYNLTIPIPTERLKKKKKIRSLEDSGRLTALKLMRDSGHESLGCAARIKQMRVNKRLLEKSVMGWKSGGLSAIPSLF